MLFIKKYKSIILLSLIIVVAVILRFYALQTAPFGLSADEAAFGYNTYSFLETGKDEYGKSFPLVLKSFADYKSALYSYLSIPFVWIFGLTPFATRFASSLFSVLTVFMVYLLTRKLLKNETISLISAAVFSITPWGINIARTTGDVTIDLFFLTLLTFSLLKAVEDKGFIWIIIGAISAILAVLSSQIARIHILAIPILISAFFVFKNKGQKLIRNKIFYSFVLFILFIIIYSSIASIDRLNQVSIFSHPQTDLVLHEQIREDQNTKVLVTRVFHNKIVNYGRTILTNYGQYFTLDFLALTGGYPFREKVIDTGLLYLWQIPFLLFGIFLAFKSKSREKIFLVVWWFILTVPSAFTFDEIPNVHRSIIALPAVCILISIGIYEFFITIRKYKKVFAVVALLFSLLLVYELSYYGHQYLVHQEKHQSWYRGSAYNSLVPALEEYYPNYKKIIISKSVGSPYIYILFFSKYDPRLYQEQGSPRDLDFSGFDKYYFVPHDCPLDGGATGKGAAKGEAGALYINKGTCKTPVNGKLLRTIRWGDGSPAFNIVEYLAK